MSLLADLFAGKGLDPGYAEAAARRGDRPPGRLGRAGVLATLVLVGMLLVMAGEQVRRSEPLAQRQRDRLIAEIRRRTAETDGLQRGLEGLRTETDQLRAAALARSAAGRAAQDWLTRAADAAAARAVSGPALVITLDDARRPDPAGPGDGRVYDLDLQIVVNGLWRAGATAIGINGERFGATTAIRTAGKAVTVDYRPLLPPYVITALGDPDRLESAFGTSAASRALRTLAGRYGIRSAVRKVSDAALPAAVAGGLRYAREETAG